MPHARYSPSSAHRWLRCPASIAMAEKCPDSSNDYADEGTAAHFLAAHCLNTGDHPTSWLTHSIAVGVDENGVDRAEWLAKAGMWPTIRWEGRVDVEMAGHVNHYVRAIRQYAEGGSLEIEQAVPVGDITGEAGATGTADAVILTADNELQVHDLKYGRSEVDAEENEQLALYLAAVLPQYELLDDVKSLRVFIHQPRAGGEKSWAVSREWLAEFLARVPPAVVAGEKARTSDPIPDELYAPGDTQCWYCPGKATCPKLATSVAETVFDVEGFDNLDAPTPEAQQEAVAALTDASLGAKLSACDLIEKWVAAVRAAVERRLLSANNSEAARAALGYKLVGGRKGARAWADETQAEALLKSMRLKQEEMYNFKLISPPQAEKIFGEKGTQPSTKRWNKLQALIEQADGKPSVAPVSDKRPALVIDNTAQFDDLTGDDLV